MRILIVSYGYPPREPRVWTYHLAQALGKRHQLWLYVPARDGGIPNFAEWDERVGSSYVRRVVNNISAPWDWFGYERIPQIEQQFVSFVREVQPDVVHFELLTGTSVTLPAYTRQFGIPSVHSFYDHSWVCPRIHLVRPDYTTCPGPSHAFDCVTCVEGGQTNQPDSWRLVLHDSRLQLQRTLLDSSTMLTTCSGYLRDYMSSVFQISPERFRVIPLGLTGMPPQKEVRPAGDKVNICYLGSIVPYKGIHVLIQAAKRLQDLPIEVRIHGEVLYPPYMDKLRELGDTIIYAGPYHPDQLTKVLSQADILVLPSLAPETFSFVIREAALAGVPVVASRIGAIPEVIEHGQNGLLVSPGSVDELAAALRQLVLDPALRARLAASHPPIRSIEDYATEMEEIYHEISASNR